MSPSGDFRCRYRRQRLREHASGWISIIGAGYEEGTAIWIISGGGSWWLAALMALIGLLFAIWGFLVINQ